LQREEERLLADQATLRKDLQDVGDKIGIVRQDLKAGRDNMTIDGDNSSKLTVRDIVEQFDGLYQMILDIGQEARRSCEKRSLVAKPSTIANFGKDLGINDINNFLAKTTQVLKKPDIHVGIFIGPIVCHILCDRLLRHVFEPFAPGMEQSKSDFFNEMYQTIAEEEGLDKATRWRAVTYSQLDPPLDDFARKLAKKILTYFDQICSGTPISEVLKNNRRIKEGVHSLVQKTVQFQYANRRNCVVLDLSPYKVNFGQKLDPVMMEPFDPNGANKPAFVVLATALGLEHQEKESRPDGSMFTQHKIWKPATAVCTNWSFI
jgi:hypothetical protein